MSTSGDPVIAEFEAQMRQLHAESDNKLASRDRLVAKMDAHLQESKERVKKIEKLIAESKVISLAPLIFSAAQQLPSAELKLKVAKYELERKTEECKRFEAKRLDALKSEYRVRKVNEQLTKTVETLTAQLESEATPEHQPLKTENEKLKEELAIFKAQLKSKIEECEQKDDVIATLTKEDTVRAQDIQDLREDFDAYQKMASNTWAHRHDGCNELNAALEEQCAILTTQCEDLQSTVKILESNLDTLHHKNNTLAMERDDLQGNLDDAIKAHKMELEDLETLKCEGYSGCSSCVTHLDRALRQSRAAEAKALQRVDLVNHDRRVAWNQMHEHLANLVQEHFASGGAWAAARQTPSPSLVSSTPELARSGNDGWKISDICTSSEVGSIDFVL